MATTETQESSEVGSDLETGRRKWLGRAVIIGARRSRLLKVGAHVSEHAGTESAPIRFPENGEIEMELTQPGAAKRQQTMVSWTGAFAGKIQQME
jgi:hypothetical protein